MSAPGLEVATAGDARRRTVRRLAQACLALVAVIVALSAWLRHDGAWSACPDGPGCQAVAPALEAGRPAGGDAITLARLGHRIAASTSLIVIVVLLLGCLAKRPRLRAEGVHALALLLLAVWLAGLGATAGDSRLPAVVLGNLLGGFAMLAVGLRLVRLAGDGPGRQGPIVSRRGVLGVLFLLVVVIALGALASSGPTCGTPDECLAQVAGGGWDLARLDPWRLPAPADEGGLAAAATVQVVHHVAGLVAAAAVILLLVSAWRATHRRSALALACLLAATGATGLLLARGGVAVPLVVLHSLCAGCLLAVTARMA